MFARYFFLIKDELLILRDSRELNAFNIDDVRFDNILGINFTTNCVKSTVHLITIIYFSLWKSSNLITILKNYVNGVNLCEQ